MHPSSKELYNIITYNSLQRSNIATLVVPDYLVEDLPVLNSFLNVQYKRDMVSVDEVFYKNITPHIRVGNTKVLFTTKEEVHLFEPSVRVVVSYTAAYIGIILLLTSTAILSLKQLTHLVDAKDEINIIKKLGGDYGMIYKTILLRTLWEYILPLVIALIHSYFGIKAISNIIASDITTSSLFNILFIVLMFFIFYGFYYLLTYFNGKRILKEIYI